MSGIVDYRRKIKKLPELVEHLAGVRQGKLVGLCHGVFDLVHPGHIRHLRFAREKCDILVVSLTCDAGVQKGKDRPYITEELRAENLAALEMVDHVYIDSEPTPIRTLQALQPDIYVKGYEYSGNRPDATHKTAEEMQIVADYGGAMIFSPGDIVFSSTKFLATEKPHLPLEKLSAMFRAFGLGKADILGGLEGLKDARILLVGDTIIDRYNYCTTLGASTKTPTLSVKRDTSETYIGGAGIVAQHMASFGATVHLVTLVGADREAEQVAKTLPRERLGVSLVTDATRPTTRKEVFETNGYKLLQVDELDNTPIFGETLARVEDAMLKHLDDVHTVVFSDFRHGLLHKANIPHLVELAKKAGKRVIADTQVSSRWGNILDYRHADLLCATEREARFAVADQDCGLIDLGRKCLVEADAQALILKLGEKGLIAFEYPHGGNKEFFAFEALARSVVDAKGSGDAVLSVAALALSTGVPLLTGALLSSCAAALHVERMGNVPIPFQDLSHRVHELVGAMSL